jgi:hypothetical protein
MCVLAVDVQVLPIAKYMSKLVHTTAYSYNVAKLSPEVPSYNCPRAPNCNTTILLHACLVPVACYHVFSTNT